MSMTMYDYILEEESVLKKIIREFQEYKIQAKRIKIFATGSSNNAANCVKYFMQQRLNCYVEIEEPYNFTHFSKMDDSDLAIFISQSLHSASIIEAFYKVKRESTAKTILVSANSSSELKNQCDYFLDLNIGEEKVGFVTKGFSATVLNLILLADSSKQCKETLEKIVGQFPKIIKQTNDFIEEHKEILENGKRFSCITYGDLYGVAKEFETKFQETVRKPSSGFELEAYMHGPYLEVDENHILFFLTDQDEIRNRANLLENYLKPSLSFSKEFYIGDLLERVEGEKCMKALAFALVVQILSCQVTKLQGIDLTIRKFDDFDQYLESKI